jgi:hypothetical protein
MCLKFCEHLYGNVLKMDYKRQTAVVAIFALVGMMFVVPAITGKAMALPSKVVARADGRCGTTPCDLRLITYVLISGFWVITPTQDGTLVGWNAQAIHGVGNVAGVVTYGIIHDGERVGTATFTFLNPLVGPNHCTIVTIPSVPGACDKGSGHDAKFFYHFVVPSLAGDANDQESDNNGDAA